MVAGQHLAGPAPPIDTYISINMEINKPETLDHLVQFRLTETDKISLKKAARAKGLQTSTLVRMVLLESGILKAN